MSKNLSFINFIDDDEKRVVCSALELAERSRESRTRVSSFLNIREQQLIKTALLSDGSFCFTFFGGFRDAERRVLVVFPEYLSYSMLLENGCIDAQDEEIFKLSMSETAGKISLLHISNSAFAKLSHRDYMGAVLALGIERHTIGDIIIDGDNGAYIFALPKIAEFIFDNLTAVGKTPVNVQICSDYSNIKLKHNTQSMQVVTTSLRLDCVISAICNISRDKSKSIVTKELAELNYYSKASPDDTVADGDIISVRGYGKYKIADSSGVTLKGKSRITVLKYI